MTRRRWSPPPWKGGDRIYNSRLKKTAHYKGQWAVGRAKLITKKGKLVDTGRSGEWVWALTDEDNEEIWPLDDVVWVGHFYEMRLV